MKVLSLPTNWRSRIAALLLLALAELAAAEPSPAAIIEPLGPLTVLNVPEAAKGTFAVGVSNGNVVGGYYSSSAANHGFLYNGSYTPLDFPGSKTTTTSGISGNNIVGFYTDNVDRRHGFVFDGLDWSTIDYPNQNYTVVTGITGNTVVGYFSDGTSIRGFEHVLGSPDYPSFGDPTPGVQATVPYGMSGGDIVGFYIAADQVHGFRYRDGSFLTLDFPGSISTAAYGISGSKIVGDYQDAAGTYHGFIYDGTTWDTINVSLPGTIGTQAYGISGNLVVGQYVDSSFVNHGFIAEIPEPASIVLAAMGVLAWCAARRRWRRSGIRGT
jgi:hypothetical protein